MAVPAALPTTDIANAEALKRVLGHYPSGVTVVTAVDDGEPVGFSCQSFHSLSLDPPMVLLLAGRSSTSWPRIRRAARFCVNVLADRQAEMCRRFAVSGGDKFADVEWSPSPSGTPVLAGTSAWIDCVRQDEFDGGDHLIVTGRVVGLGADPSVCPLIFHRGAFRGITAID